MAATITKRITYQYKDGLTFDVVVEQGEARRVQWGAEAMPVEDFLRIAHQVRELSGPHNDKSVCPEHGYFKPAKEMDWSCQKCRAEEAGTVDDNLVPLLRASVEAAKNGKALP